MAREHARIFVSIWEDADFLALGMAEQWTYMALLSSPDLSWCGVLPLLPQRLGRLSRDGSPAKAAKALAGLGAARFVLVDEGTAEVCIRTYVRHDGVMKQPNVVCAAIKAWAKVHSDPIREAIREEFAKAYAEGFPEGFGEGFAKAFGRSFPEGFPEGFANSPSPFPLPPSFSVVTTKSKPRVGNARAAEIGIGGDVA